MPRKIAGRPPDAHSSADHRRPNETSAQVPPTLVNQGFMREPEVLNLFPVGRSTWWEGVRKKRYPQPVKLAPRVTAWRVSDILVLLKSIQAQSK